MSYHHNSRRQVAIKSTLQMKKLRHGEMREIVQVHSIGKMLILGFRARHLGSELGPLT